MWLHLQNFANTDLACHVSCEARIWKLSNMLPNTYIKCLKNAFLEFGIIPPHSEDHY